jgi:Bacterial alpha-L-rhamnosidase C-terminal domain
VTYYNALYVLALQNAATIANFLFKGSDADRWTARAQTVSNAINTYNFDSSVGAFYDGTCGDSYCQTHAQDGNSLSIVAGVTNGTRASSILSYLSKANTRPYGNAFYDNDLVGSGYSQRVYAFISYFEIEARFISGQADSALEEIRRLYGWMSTHDPEITQWEGIGPNGQPYEGAYTSMAHGWGTGIVPTLTNYILGVIPSEPGFSVYTIKPMPGDVEWAKGVVPTQRGPITVSWQQNKALGLFYLTATAPAGTEGTIYVPVSNSSVPVYLDSKAIPNSFHKRDSEAGSRGGYVSVSVKDGLTHTISVGYIGP